MNLRKKTLLISAVTLAVMLLGLYGAAYNIILPSYAALEERAARRSVERFHNVLTDNLSYFNNELRDWAAWDESYSFIAGANPNYVKKNIPDQTYADLKLNLVVFIDLSGQVVYAKGFDLKKNKETPLPPGLGEHISPGRPLMQLKEPKSSITGILLLPGGPMFIAAQPIITTERKGPSRGILIFGRYLDETEIERLSQITQVSIRMHRLNDPQMPADFTAARAALSAEKSILIKTLSEEAIAGYTQLQDIYGRQALLLRLEMPRDIYKQGRTTIGYFSLILIMVGLIIGGLALLVLERTITARLAHLTQKVKDIEATGDYAQRMAVRGRDEITLLAEEINVMLASLEQYSRQLKEISVTDGLTGLFNHRYFYERMREEVKRAARYEYPLSLLIVDVDFFKNYNDAHGHLEGDNVLKEIAAVIKKNVRQYDIVARYGGDEFSVILPETSKDQAAVLAERIRQSIKNRAFIYEEVPPVGLLTLSLGIATFPQDARRVRDLVKLADEALYRAKNGGKDRVEGG